MPAVLKGKTKTDLFKNLNLKIDFYQFLATFFGYHILENKQNRYVTNSKPT